MASGVYNRGKLTLVDGSITWTSTAIGVMMVTGTYTPDDAHNFVSDVSTNELSGGGYVRGTLSGKSGPTENDTNNAAEYDATDQTFSSLSSAAGTPRYVITYDNTNAADASRELIAWYDIGTTNTTPNGGNYVIQWPAPMLSLT